MNILYTIAWVLGRVLLWLYRVETRGAGELPQNGVLLCPNHASDIDPVLIALCLPRRYCLHFMAKAELFEKPFVSWLLRTLGAIVPLGGVLLIAGWAFLAVGGLRIGVASATADRH